MRFEGKYRFFKHFMFFLLAERQQMYVTQKMLGMDGNRNANFVYAGNIIGEGS